MLNPVKNSMLTKESEFEQQGPSCDGDLQHTGLRTQLVRQSSTHRGRRGGQSYHIQRKHRCRSEPSGRRQGARMCRRGSHLAAGTVAGADLRMLHPVCY